MNTCTPKKFLRPASTIVEKADGYLIEADMPGVTREGLAITVKDDTLTITGRRTNQPANTAHSIANARISTTNAALNLAVKLTAAA